MSRERLSSDGERAWSAPRAFVGAWLLPATTARRTAGLRLWKAYIVHVLAAVLTVALLFAFLDDELVREIEREVQGDPIWLFVLIFMVIASVEFAFVAGAAVVMPWGARDEPLGASYARSLRQSWMRTSHLPPIVLMIGGLFTALDVVSSQWYGANPQRMPATTSQPVPPADNRATPEAWEAYWIEMEASQAEWSAAWDAYRLSQPWYVRYGEVVLGYACFLAATWILWGWFRAVGVRPSMPQVARPPMCETCGYNLSATARDGRCPECGASVEASLGDDARPGVLWERRRETGRIPAWWHSSVTPILHPARLGRTVRLSSACTDYRRFLVLHLVPVFFIAASGVVTSYVFETGRNPFRAGEQEVVTVAATLIGYCAAVGVFLLAVVSAALVGVGYRITGERNLMGGAMQIAAYLAGYLVLFAVFAAAWFVGIVWVAENGWLRTIAVRMGIAFPFVYFLIWLVPVSLFVLVYIDRVRRATGAARYANR